MSTHVGIRLHPIDILFFRDGRPFVAASRGKSDVPRPQTVAGALFTALLRGRGCDFSSFGDPKKVLAHYGLEGVRVQGPWFARATEDRDGYEVLVPVPASVHRRKKQTNGPLQVLKPLKAGVLPGWQPLETGMRPLWHREHEPTEPAEGFLTGRGLEKWLKGEKDPPTSDEVVKREEVYEFDHRTGIGLSPDRGSAEEGLIYGATFLALKDRVCLYTEVILPDESLRPLLDGLSTLPLGGECRRARVEVLKKPYAWPAEPKPEKGQGKLLLLTTPGLFAGQDLEAPKWRPPALAGRLAAAAVPRAVAVSGWDYARRGPKPTRFAADAGTVYYLNPEEDHSLPDPLSLCDNAEDRRQGWGCYLKGVWNDG